MVANEEVMLPVQSVHNPIRFRNAYRPPKHVPTMVYAVALTYDSVMVLDQSLRHVIDVDKGPLAEPDYVRVPVMFVRRKEIHRASPLKYFSMTIGYCSASCAFN